MYVMILPFLNGLLVYLLCQGTNFVSTQETSPVDKRNASATGYWSWDVSDWSECKFHKPGSQSACVKQRTVTCVFTQDWSVVPPFYCSRYASNSKPETEKSCSPCQRPCILSDWGPWSLCSCGKKHRTRSVLYLPPGGAVEQCEPTVEQTVCEDDNSTCDKTYSWKHGEWSSCYLERVQDGDSTGESDTLETASENTDFPKQKKRKKCPAGVRSRHVYCLHLTTLTQVDHQFCSHFTPDREPENLEPCDFPCSCEVSEWEPWGLCTISCTQDPTFTGYQSRRRHVTMKPGPGGASCPVLEHTRQCPFEDVPLCESNNWKVTDWDECQVSTDQTSQCGSGFQTRRVHCSKETADETLEIEVDDELCLNDTVLIMNREMKPAETRACDVPCPSDCQLGEWQNWSSCTKSCGSDGTRIRTKPAVSEAAHGGKECEQEYETKECEDVPCYWWHSGQWSACFLNNHVETCGSGSQVRNVYCMSALDEAVLDQLCVDLHGLGPLSEQTCIVPCEDQCELSEWSDWSECTATCGPKGGTQIRTRQIEGQKFGEVPCVPDDQLKQTRPCNQRPCRLFLWQVSAWSECQPKTNVTADTCVGSTPGTRTRQTFCQLNYGYSANETYCKGHEKPVSEEDCSAPCPIDCILGKASEWSPCSKTCGRDSVRQRYRPVMQLDAHGGIQCPNGSVETGYATETRRCRKVPKCHIYEWSVGNWSSCQLTTADCGYGYKTRTVACFRNEHRKVTPEHCLGEEPEGEMKCFEPCPGDCEITTWSKWSPCPSSCSEDGTEHYQTRTRELLFKGSSEEAVEKCYNLTNLELADKKECEVKHCPTYLWNVGNWSSCIPHSNRVCGRGTQRRNVVCQREDKVEVESHLCESLGIPVPKFAMSCDVPCAVDCEVSEWSEWDLCSHVCGNGLKERRRTVLNEKMYGGRECPEIVQSSLCMETECDLLQWSVSEWSSCKPNYGMPCGRGVMTRLVDCVADEKCEVHQPKPLTYIDCDVPCLGDCVTSEWSEWSECLCTAGSAQPATRVRSRSIVTEPLPSAQQCRELEEIEECPCYTYQKEFLNWTSCDLLDDKVCGAGKKIRALACVRNDNVPVSLSYCDLSPDDSVEKESCSVQCSVDCEVTDFGPWSSCSQTCGLDSQRMRWSLVKIPQSGVGRQCPLQEDLKQIQPCEMRVCYTYTWHTEPWGECSIGQTSCGQGLKRRRVHCRRSDYIDVADSYCNVTISGERPQTEKMCGTPCPLDCVVTEWSMFGPCFNSCATEYVPLQFRSRSIIQPKMSKGLECPEPLVDSRKCAVQQSICPIATWRAENWKASGLRSVKCTLPQGNLVSEGCLEEQKPIHKKQCERFYDCEEHAECIDGQCVCLVGFTDVDGTCLPEFGCMSTLHCIANSSTCDVANKNCVCYDGSLPTKGVFCLSAYPGETSDGSNEINYLFLFVLIGIMCLLLLIALLIVVALLRRKKKKTYYSPAPAALSKIDNLDNMKNNQKQKQESPLLLKHQYGMSSVNDLEKAPTPTYPSNFTYNYDVIDKDGSPALIGGMKKRKNKVQLLSVDGQVYDEGETVPKAREANEEMNRLRMDEPSNHINADSPSNDSKPLLPPPSPSRHLHENPMTTFKPNDNSDANIAPSTIGNARPNTLLLGAPSGSLPPPVAPRNTVATRRPGGQAYRPKPPPKPKVTKPSEGYATMPLHPTPPEAQNAAMSNTSPRGKPKSKNPASARLLEYCDELLAELEHMAKN